MPASDRQRAWNGDGRGLHPWAWKRRLTTVQQTAIRRRLAAGERTADLAVEYGVSRSTINRYR